MQLGWISSAISNTLMQNLFKNKRYRNNDHKCLQSSFAFLYFG